MDNLCHKCIFYMLRMQKKKKKNNNDNKLTKRNEKTITPLHY